jgi:D-glycero-D-manno-heptose 1,7-bisphosphate phosphatase
MKRPAAFLDRDGTLIHEAGYLARLEDLRWFAWSTESVRLLNRAGFLVFVITNQSGVGFGLYGEAFVQQLHGIMAGTLERGGAHVDGWFYCPHHPDARVPELKVVCRCRKPEPGMVEQACAKFDIDLAASVVVGDKLSDVTLANRVGASGVLVRTGYGEDLVREHGVSVPGAAFVAGDLAAAVAWTLERARDRQVLR